MFMIWLVDRPVCACGLRERPFMDPRKLAVVSYVICKSYSLSSTLKYSGVMLGDRTNISKF